MLFFTFSFTLALSIESFTTAIDQTSTKKGSVANQINFLRTLETLLKSSNFTSSTYKDIFTELSRYTTEKINKLTQQGAIPSGTTIKSSDGTSYLNLSNVNSTKIREMLLMWHNQERILCGASPYAYHSDLEKSAQIRADNLRAEERTSNTHTRNSGDGYYNYASITNWFANLNIKFPSAGGGKASFSESVGRGYYNCTSSDCTEQLITALKTTRDFFMSEKSRNGEHYRAITMGHFKQMGIGVSIDTEKKRYYLVIHYGMEIIE